MPGRPGTCREVHIHAHARVSVGRRDNNGERRRREGREGDESGAAHWATVAGPAAPVGEDPDYAQVLR